MKRILLLLLAIPFMLLLSCQSKSYYAAQNANHQRFGGWDLENANYLMETNNQVLLLQNLSALAMTQAKLRETFLASEEANAEYQNLLLDLKIEAAAKRVKLSSALSEENDKIYQKLKSLSPEDFDAQYQRAVLQKIADLKKINQKYITDGHNEGLVDFAGKVLRIVEPLETRMKAIEIS